MLLNPWPSLVLQLIGASVHNLESINAFIRSTCPWQMTSLTVSFWDTHTQSPRASCQMFMLWHRHEPQCFQDHYTSKDNSSFTQILNDENARWHKNYGQAWDAQKCVEVQRTKMIEARGRVFDWDARECRGEREDEDRGTCPGRLITAQRKDRDGSGHCWWQWGRVWCQ